MSCIASTTFEWLPKIIGVRSRLYFPISSAVSSIRAIRTAVHDRCIYDRWHAMNEPNTFQLSLVRWETLAELNESWGEFQTSRLTHEATRFRENIEVIMNIALTLSRRYWHKEFKTKHEN